MSKQTYEELQAQVEQLSTALKATRQPHMDFIPALNKTAQQVLEATPAQCLTERDIATIQAFANKYCGECRSDEQVWLNRKALEYTKQLHQQAKGGE